MTRSHALRRRSGIALAALVATILISSTEISAQKRVKSTRPLSMTATAYCDQGETKSGTQAKPGIVAADPRVLPLGTTIRVAGLTSRRLQTFTVADTGAEVKGNEIDIFMGDCGRAKRFGRRPVQVRVLRAP